MKLRHCLAINISPAIARLALAATFLWFGFGKLQTIEYTGNDAQILIKLGVGKPAINTKTGPTQTTPALPAGTEDIPDQSRRNDNTPANGTRSLQNTLTSTAFAFQDQSENTQPDKEVSQPKTDEPPTTEELQNNQQPANETVQAYKFHMITIMLHRAGNPHPVALARMALVVETVGGILILIGLFTRIWALGLAITMAFAFSLTTWAALVNIVNDPAITGLSLVYHGLSSIGNLDFNAQTTAFLQLTLFSLSWIVVFSGPGALSLDNLIFRPRTNTNIDTLDEEP